VDVMELVRTVQEQARSTVQARYQEGTAPVPLFARYLIAVAVAEGISATLAELVERGWLQLPPDEAHRVRKGVGL
jgi:hypothetical protein